ncbi:MAG: radical SAM family heme chaperone HemW [Actinomycetota bacterium]
MIAHPAPAPEAVWNGLGDDGVWKEEPGFGVYVHIPFCVHRCHYCDFNTYEGLESLHRPYVDALVRQIEGWPGSHPAATSIFFGGGTPTLLDSRELGRVLGAIGARFGIAPGSEITVEANPETVDRTRFTSLLEHGFNRVSIGVQSLVPHVLRGLGRTHSVRDALDAITAAHGAGFTNINADLIYGSPWESPEDWRVTLEAVVAARPAHVSAYALTVEEGTPLATLVRTGRLRDVDPDVQADRHGVAESVLDAGGYGRYEISNWAMPGRASRHNVLYWCAGDYLGFGAGAHAHVDGHRWWNRRLPRDFIAAATAGELPVAGEERLDAGARAGEALMLGLRLRDGIDLAGFAHRFGASALDERARDLDSLISMGLLERDAGRLRLTVRGTLVANDALCRLL